MNPQKYTISAPIGSGIAPVGQINEEELRRFGAQLSTDEVWKDKFKNDPIADVLEFFKTAGYTVTTV